MWFGLVSIVMLFAGLTSAVVVRKGDGNWLNYELPDTFLWSTLTIVASSICLIAATTAIKRNASDVFKGLLSLTFLLGLVFIWLQFEGYDRLVDQNVYFTGAAHNASGSFLYIISGLHLAHLIGGLLAMAVVLFHAFKDYYKPKNLLGLQLCSTYWHFMGAMWVYLYFFFKVII